MNSEWMTFLEGRGARIDDGQVTGFAGAPNGPTAILCDLSHLGLLAVAGGTSVTILVMNAIFDSRIFGLWPVLAWSTWLVAMYFAYRKYRHDLFMLAGLALSGIVVVMSFMMEKLIDNFHEATGFLVIAILIIGMGTGAAIWLKGIHKEWQS